MIRKIKKFISVIVTLALLISGTLVLPPQALAASSYTISGTVSLFQDEGAPEGGIEGKVYISPRNGDSYYSADFTIPKGVSSADYIVTVPGDDPETEYEVRYYLHNTYPGYVGGGYYSTSGTTYYSNATLVNVSAGNVTGKDLTIFTGNTISGTISLPEGMEAPAEGLEGSVNVSSADGGYYSAPFIIDTISNTASYTATVSSEDTNKDYRVSYNLYETYPGYVGDGYYSVDGTTTNYSNATLVNVSAGNVTGKDLTIFTGNTISGTILLPEGVEVPAGGIEGSIEISSPNGGSYYNSHFKITTENNPVTYTVTASSEDSNKEYLVDYYLYDQNPGFIGNGYYSSTGTVDYSDATRVNLTVENKLGIDLTINTGNIISGLISLPSGVYAPEGGLEGSVHAAYQNGGNNSHSNFYIPSGRNSASYTVTVPKDALSEPYRVSYSLNNRYNEYLNEGYYSVGGTTTDDSLATLVDASSNGENIHLTIYRGNIISGTISLPGDAVAPSGGLSGNIYGSSQTDNGYYYGNFSIPTGVHSTSYSVTVPKYATVTEFEVRYSLYSNIDQGEYLSEGYYSEDGTVTNNDLATSISVSGNNIADINLELLTGTIISGTISLPASEIAPSEGLEGSVYISPLNGGTSYNTHFMIDPGASSVNYSAIVPTKETASSYRVAYYLYSNSDSSEYFGSGYYITGGTTTDYSSATPVSVGAVDISGIDLTLLMGTLISNTISLPGLEKAPSGGIRGNVNFSPVSGGTNYDGDFRILAGDSSATCTITVPAAVLNTEFRVSYSLSNNYLGYVPYGYYSSEGTKADSSSATPISLSEEAGVEITLLQGVVISGIVSLPGSETAPSEGIRGQVDFFPVGSGHSYNADLYILSGKSSANYSVTLPMEGPSTEYRVRYSLDEDYSAYVTDGYYASSGGTTTDSSLATKVNVSAGDQTGINLTVLTGTSISGTILLPGLETAPTGGISGSIYVSSVNGGNNYNAYLSIPAGDRSADYTVTVPVDATNTEYRVSYSLNDNSSNYLLQGYYSAGGTTSDNSSATKVNVSTGSQPGINLTLLTGATLAGTISLPGLETAPSGGIVGTIYYSPVSGGDSYHSSFNIPLGESSADYAVTVPGAVLNTACNVWYSLNQTYLGYTPYGYYSAVGTTSNYYSQTSITVNEENDVAITMLKGSIISGTISLPELETAPSGGIQGQVYFSPVGGGGSYNAYLNIPAGGRSADYTVTVPKDGSNTQYIVSYSLDDNYRNYLDEGYYSGEETTSNEESVLIVNTSAGNQSGVNLTLLTGAIIAGTISLPGSETALSGGITGYIELSPVKAVSDYHTLSFNIPAGGRFGTYTVTVPKDASNTEYRVRYYLYDNLSNYLREGYYSGEDTTPSYNLATIVDVSGGNQTAVNLTLLTPLPDDHSNTIASATEINIGTNTSGQIDPAGDIDYFKFTPSRSGNYSFTSISDYDTYGELFDANENELGYNDDTGEGSNFLITQDLQAGQVYYIKAKMLNSYQTGNYQIKVTETPIAVTSVTLNNYNLSLAPGQTELLIATITPDNATDQAVNWSVSSESLSGMVTLSDSGLVTAVNAGTAVIRATSNADGTKYAEANVTVAVLPTVIAGTIELPWGEKAPVGGLTGYVSISPQYGGAGDSVYFSIPEGSSEANYTVNVPENPGTGYRVNYSLNDNYSEYIGYGYYSTTEEMTTYYYSASIVDVSGGSASDVNLTILAKRTISGTISLPEGMEAPIGGIYGSVYLTHGAYSYVTDFDIPEGGSSASFTREVSALNDEYSVRYSLHNYFRGYLREGYYNTAGTTTDSSLATLLDLSKGEGGQVNLELLTGTVISGTISLPEGVIPPTNGLAGSVSIISQDQSKSYYNSFNIPAGESSAGYDLTVPVDASITSYRVGYSLNNKDYLPEGYYSTGGTTNLSSATWINPNLGNRTDIDLTVLTGQRISGTFSLPDGETVQVKELRGYISIWAADNSKNYYLNFNIPKGESTASYSVQVPEDSSISGYYVGYTLNDPSDSYVRNGYYSATGSTIFKNATLVSVQDGNASDIKLTPMTGHTVSGTVFLPNEALAPVGGLDGSVNISTPKDPDGEDQGGGGSGGGVGGGSASVASVSAGTNEDYDSVSYYADFYISPGQNSGTYTSEVIPIDATISGYNVYYKLRNSSEYVSGGYYSETGTTISSTSATLVDVNAGNMPNINLTLLTGKRISGKVSLPNDALVTDQAIQGEVYIDPQNGENGYYANFYMPVGETSEDYSVIVPVDASISGYLVSYSLYNNYGYVREGYYSATGGTTPSKLATLVSADAGNVGDINLTLLTGNTISGTISMPGGIPAPVGGINLSVSIDPMDGGNPYSIYRYIQGGRTSASYTLTVPVNASGTGYSVSYVLNKAMAGYLDQGYYSSTGTTTPDSNLASPVDVSTGNASNVDLVLLTGDPVPIKPTAPVLTIDDTANTVTGMATGMEYKVDAADYVAYAASDFAALDLSGVHTLWVRVAEEGINPPSDAVTLTFTANITPPEGFSAAPVVKIGVNPSAGDIVGMFVGLKDIINSEDTTSQPHTIGSYLIEVTYDPNQVSISGVLDASDSGTLFSQTTEVVDDIAKVIVSCAAGGSIENYDKLFFIPITLNGSALEQTSISVKYVDVRDTDLDHHQIQIPTLENLKFQRGKIYNRVVGIPNLPDAIAGLQYLAKLRNAGMGPEEVNLVNMASITESGVTSKGVQANVKDIIALMQYNVNLRDNRFLPVNPE